MAAVLADRLGFTVIKGYDLGRDPMEDLLGEFEGAIAGADAALLFFAGHGLQVNGHNYLTPVDADIRQEVHLKRRAFRIDELLDIMVRRARSSLVFLDACRDNPFARSLLSGMSAQEQGRFLPRSGLAEIKASKGTFIAFATAPDNVAQDGAGDNSPFTEGLLAHIETPNESVSDLMIKVRQHVLEATRGHQEPWDQSSLRERFCFKVAIEPRPQAVVPTPASIEAVSPGPIDDRTLEHTYWQSVQASTDAAEFVAFLEKFPAGTFAALAFERAKTAIDAIQPANVLRRLLNRFPDSKLAPRVRKRLAVIEWARLRNSRDAVALKNLSDEFDGLPEAELARQRAALLDMPLKSPSRWRWVGAAVALLSVAAVLAGQFGLLRNPIQISAQHDTNASQKAAESAAQAKRELEVRQQAEADAKAKMAAVERQRLAEEANRKSSEDAALMAATAERKRLAEEAEQTKREQAARRKDESATKAEAEAAERQKLLAKERQRLADAAERVRQDQAAREKAEADTIAKAVAEQAEQQRLAIEAKRKSAEEAAARQTVEEQRLTAVEATNWAQAKRAATPYSMQAYLDQYPSGLHTEQARDEFQTLLAQAVQTALQKAGCDPGDADGKWGPKARNALRDYARYAKVTLQGDDPTMDILQSFRQKSDRVCPPQSCDSGEKLVNNKCVKIEKSGTIKEAAPVKIEDKSCRMETWTECRERFYRTNGPNPAVGYLCNSESVRQKICK